MSERSDAADSPTETDESRTNVAIRESLRERVATRIEQSDFETETEYVEYVLEEVLSRVESDETTDRTTSADPLGRADDEEGNEEVENRLESLGYL